MKPIFLLISGVLLMGLASCGTTPSDVKSDENPSEISEPIDSNRDNAGIDAINIGAYRDAIDFFEKIDTPTETEKLLLAKAYLNYGTAFYKESEYAEKALALLDSLREDADTLYYRGYAAEITGQYNQAIEYYEKGLTLADLSNDQKTLLTTQLGHVYDLLGSPDKADEYYQKAEKLSSNTLSVLMQRGRAEYAKRNYAAAKTYFEKVLTSTNNTLTRAEIYYNLSSIAAIEESIDAGIDYAEQGIAENSDYPGNYLNLGIFYTNFGKEEYLVKAEENLKKTLELSPRSAIAHKYLGIIAYIRDDFDEAVKQFELCRDLALSDISLMTNERGKIYDEAIYDLARSYGYLDNAAKTIENLDKLLLTPLDKGYLPQFLSDFARENGPFQALNDDAIFQQKMLEYIRFRQSTK